LDLPNSKYELSCSNLERLLIKILLRTEGMGKQLMEVLGGEIRISQGIMKLVSSTSTSNWESIDEVA